MTDPKMVKNFRVVVMMEQVSGPNVETVMKMKVWKEKRGYKNLFHFSGLVLISI